MIIDRISFFPFSSYFSIRAAELSLLNRQELYLVPVLLRQVGFIPYPDSFGCKKQIKHI